MGDTYTFSIDYAATSDSTYFSIDGTSGVITFATSYDVDTSYSNNVTLIVVCTDSAGLTGNKKKTQQKILHESLTLTSRYLKTTCRIDS